MKRCLFKLALFLILGAVVNVAVAWGCAAIFTVKETTSLYINAESENADRISNIWEVRRAIGFGQMQIAFNRMRPSPRNLKRPALVNRADTRLHGIEPPDSRWRNLQVTFLHVLAGWPVRSLASQCYESDVRWSFQRQGTFTRQQVAKLGLLRNAPKWMEAIVIEDQVVGGPFSARVLPLLPIWPGFMINTIFFAIILWLPLAPLDLRRTIRRKRGLCLQCGYDLCHADHEVCPECGVQV